MGTKGFVIYLLAGFSVAILSVFLVQNFKNGDFEPKLYRSSNLLQRPIGSEDKVWPVNDVSCYNIIKVLIFLVETLTKLQSFLFFHCHVSLLLFHVLYVHVWSKKLPLMVFWFVFFLFFIVMCCRDMEKNRGVEFASNGVWFFGFSL